jgi:hypothetical protein
LIHLLRRCGIPEHVVQDPREYARRPKKEIGQGLSELDRHNTYDLSLGDQFSSIKLSDDTLENFIANRGHNPLVIVGAESLVNLGQ